jgi:penicillin-insensitive murein endopeptidase
VPPVSVGYPNEGRLQGGARLDTSLPFIRPVSVCPGVDAHWGLPVLVRMIERAARGVAKRYPGSVLSVGDMSQKSGGEIVGHHSHESGRDADIGFYIVDAKGKPLSGRSFVKFDASLTSKELPGARFDLARNWLLIQHLLTDPAARVSHIFIAEPLRQGLLAYARPRVSRALWNRAAIAMVQPSSSLPHDDHIHVRISCPRASGGECIELAKNAPSRAKLAKARRKGGHVALRTPGARGSSARTDRAAPRRGAASKLSREAPSTGDADPILRRAYNAVERAILGAPGASHEEAEADAAEVRDAVDESGAAKITD